MKSVRGGTPTSSATPPALSSALQKSKDVHDRVEAAADELGEANDVVKRRIDRGATHLPARETLVKGKAVETQVQDCADDLGKVTEQLAQGIAELGQLEGALASARATLAETESALVSAQDETRQATLRALHDGATGLALRALFDDRLAQAIASAERHCFTLAVLFLDLDRFKQVNDVHGHAAGDQVLKQVAQRLEASARANDTVCRNGGDEFLVLLMNPGSPDNVMRLAEAMHHALALPMLVDDVEHAVGASIGIAMHPADGRDADALVDAADRAMYRAKQAGGGCVMSSAASGLPAG